MRFYIKAVEQSVIIANLLGVVPYLYPDTLRLVVAIFHLLTVDFPMRFQ